MKGVGRDRGANACGGVIGARRRRDEMDVRQFVFGLPKSSKREDDDSLS